MIITKEHLDMLKPLPLAAKKAFIRDRDHGLKHAIQTLKNAKEIVEKEGGDLEAIKYAAFYHDVASIERLSTAKLSAEIRKKHAKRGARKTRTALLRMGKPPEFAERVADLISIHDQPFGTHQDAESRALYDADKLDLIGKPALQRLNSFEKTKTQRQFYDPEIGLKERINFRMGMLARDSFTVLLDNLYRTGHPDRFYTQTARAKAKTLQKELEDEAKRHISGHPHEKEMLALMKKYKRAVVTKPRAE